MKKMNEDDTNTYKDESMTIRSRNLIGFLPVSEEQLKYELKLRKKRKILRNLDVVFSDCKVDQGRVLVIPVRLISLMGVVDGGMVITEA